MAEGRGLDLSFSQLAAGALATVTATILASYFGSFGTIIGAAGSSVISTAGAAIYQHFFRRTGDKLKEAGQHVVAKGVLRPTLVSPRGAAKSTVRVPGPRPATSRLDSPEADRPKPGPKPESTSDTKAGEAGSGTTGKSGTGSGRGTAAGGTSRHGRRTRTLADIVDPSNGVTSRIGDDGPNGRSREATAGAFPIATGDTPAERPGPGSAGGLGAFGDRPEDGGAAMGAFGDAERGDDATRVEPAEGDGGTRVFAANADGGSGDGADGADGTGDGADETAVIGEDTNLAGSEDAETMAINAMSGVSEVYTASTVRPRASFAEMLSWARGRWVVLIGGAVLVFAVVMGGVTLVEKVMDKPLSDAVRGRGGSGTTLTGGSGATTPTPEPHGTPTTKGTPNPNGSGRPNPGNTAQDTPNPGRTNPQPAQTNRQPPVPSANPSSVPTSQPTSNGGENGTDRNHEQLQTQAPPGE